MIDSMGKASDAEKQRCRAGLEQVYLVVNDSLSAFV